MAPRSVTRAVWLALPLAMAAAGAAPSDGPVVYDLSPASRFEVRTGKAGLFGVFGHDHVIRADSVSGTIVYDPRYVGNSRVEVTVPVASLHVVREGADEKDGPDVEETMRHAVLHPDRHPRVRFRSRIVTRIAGGVHVVGDLELAGRSRPMAVDVALKRDGDRLIARGRFEIKQTDFGIEPYRAAAGTIRVADEVEFRFEAVGVRRPSADGGNQLPASTNGPRSGQSG